MASSNNLYYFLIYSLYCINVDFNYYYIIFYLYSLFGLALKLTLTLTNYLNGAIKIIILKKVVRIYMWLLSEKVET